MAEQGYRTAGGVQVVMFPESYIALEKELQHPAHINLMVEFAANPPVADADAMSRVCTFAGVVVDDVYDPEDLDKLCQIVLDRLITKRALSTH